MAEPKTRQTKKSESAFLDTIEDVQRELIEESVAHVERLHARRTGPDR